MAPDPYARYLQQAEELFSGGDIIRAGQIWQAILKAVPDHGPARSGLLRVKAALDAQTASAAARMEAEEDHTLVQAPPPAAHAVAPAMDGDTQDKLLREGCTLYDMGQVEDALRKWDQLLAAVPDHAMALQYAHGARKDLGLDSGHPAPPPAPAPVHMPTREIPIYGSEDEAADKLLREGCTLYDMGLSEEAIGKWQMALKLRPERSDIQSFLDTARKELASEQALPPPPPPPVPAPAAAPTPGPTAADEKVRQAQHLEGMQRHEEAAFSYQQALNLDPGHAEAQAGLARCRAAQSAHAQQAPSVTASGSRRMEPIQIEMDQPDPAPQARAPQAVQPPAALTRTAPTPRGGLQIKAPESLDPSKLPAWAKEPKTLIGAAGGLAVIVLGLIWYHGHARDTQLKSDVAAAHQAAVTRAAREAQVANLADAPAALLAEGQRALGDSDAVRAYLLAQELLRRNPSDGAAAQLLDKAKASLPLAGLVGATAEEYQKHLQEGDLDQASKVLDALLRLNPDDPNLKTQAARLSLRLAEDHAEQERWSDAQTDLQRGRAFTPGDPLWGARFALLPKIQGMSKQDRKLWIRMLG